MTIAIREMKERLERRQAELLASIQELGERTTALREVRVSTNAQGAASMTFKPTTASRQQSVLANELSLLAEVQWALKRIAEGSYGLCVVCGKPIPEKRLEALPWAALCLKDQEQLERGQTFRPLATAR